MSCSDYVGQERAKTIAKDLILDDYSFPNTRGHEKTSLLYCTLCVLFVYWYSTVEEILK
jgi:hypothetical protein